VTALPHRFGGTEYRLGERRELGHIHGDTLVDIPFPTKVRNELVAAGRAEPHHLLSDSGWISFYIREAADVERAIELLRLSYEIATKQRSPKREHGKVGSTEESAQ
jgi:predicted DNA-binding protein (MmcQ/YjbR family)